MTVKVTFDNGNSLVTGINGTEESIRKYYIGNAFNLGDGCDGDLMATAVEVEVLS